MDSGFLADLDAMDDAGRDALPFGVIGVDRHGTVVAFNAGQSRLSGIDPAHAVGRNFFTELAPATNVPAFYGRFAAGLRHGEDEVFNFVFDQVPPLRAQIHLRLSRRPNQVWIVVRPLALLEAHRPLEAQEVVRAKLIGRQIDHAVCAAEPIHIPGAIQPSGVLLAVRPDDLTIEACSANAADLLGRPPAALLGRRLDAVLPQPILDRIAQERAGDGLDG
ncbi:MAG TPA: PAS domain-containing protein, partial [Alphaproteobacteria bacterium]|nr:PAS domain-containing protein [Alphaproteobacteria bacterium]